MLVALTYSYAMILIILPNKMRKHYSKVEDKEVIINQNASGGSNNAREEESESHIKINNILITTFLVMITVILIYYMYVKAKASHKKWIEERVNSEFLKRVRSRLSGRFSGRASEDRNEEAV